jgi:hypothetical protein
VCAHAALARLKPATIVSAGDSTRDPAIVSIIRATVIAIAAVIAIAIWPVIGSIIGSVITITIISSPVSPTISPTNWAATVIASTVINLLSRGF